MIVSQNSLLNSSKVLIIIPLLIAEYLRQERPVIPHTPMVMCCQCHLHVDVAWNGEGSPLKPFALTPAPIFDYTCVEMMVQRAAAELHNIRVFGRAAWGK